MNWEAIGAIGEAIGAVGVIVTLVYLAYQIRQNTQQLAQNERTAMAGAVNTAATSYRENRRYIYTSKEVSEITLKGLKDPTSLDESESYRFRLIVQNLADALCDIHAQTVLMGFAPETWQTQGRNVAVRVLTTPGGRWFWEQYSAEYPAPFQAEIERILRSTQKA